MNLDFGLVFFGRRTGFVFFLLALYSLEEDSVEKKKIQNHHP